MNFVMVPCCRKQIKVQKKSQLTVSGKSAGRWIPDTVLLQRKTFTMNKTEILFHPYTISKGWRITSQGSHLISKISMHYRKRRWKVKCNPIGHLGSFFVICDQITIPSNILQQHSHFCPKKKICLQNSNSNFKSHFLILFHLMPAFIVSVTKKIVSPAQEMPTTARWSSSPLSTDWTEPMWNCEDRLPSI